jgi:hypothetical protein
MDDEGACAVRGAVAHLLKEFWTQECDGPVPEHLARIIDHLEDTAPSRVQVPETTETSRGPSSIKSA